MGGEYCGRNLKSMKEWIETTHEKDGVCPSCTLGLVGNWYVSELEENNQKELAVKLEEKVKNNINEKEFAGELDSIKQQVPKELKSRLQDFDCSAQSFIAE